MMIDQAERQLLDVDFIQVDLDVFIFVHIFMKFLKKKRGIRNSVIVTSSDLKEALLYCKLCLKTKTQEFTKYEEMSDEYFQEVRKYLIQYYPLTTGFDYFALAN